MRASIFPYTSRIPRSLVILLPLPPPPPVPLSPRIPRLSFGSRGKKNVYRARISIRDTGSLQSALSRKARRLVYLNNSRTELGGGNTICQHSCIYTGSRWTSSVNHGEWARNNWPRCSPVHRYVGGEHPDGQNMLCHRGCRMHGWNVVGVE